MKGEPEKLIPPHGGYARLKAYQMAEIVFDGTVTFTKLYLDKRSRTNDQMVQAARSGKQNIAEGSVFSATSKKMEIKLVSVARASQTELLEDYKDFLRIENAELWQKDHEKAVFIRKLAYRPNKSYSTYKSYVEEKGSVNAANTMICLIHQTNYLLDRLIAQLEKSLVEEGGFTEKLYRVRSEARNKRSD